MKNLLLLRAILLLMAIVGWQTSDAQTLVLHLYDGSTLDIQLNRRFSVAIIGDMFCITMPDGSQQNYERNEIRTITYKGGSERGDVNSDGNVDVADIGAVIDIMAGNEEAMGAYTKCPNDDHPHRIDLGLPSGTKWACCNVGALRPEGYGDLFAWGETTMKDSEYTWGTYTHSDDGTIYTLHDLGIDIAKTAYDAAAVNLGSNWRMPTFEQLKELYDNTTAAWTTLNGTNGMKFTGRNGASIFLPAAGYWQGDAVQSESYTGYYWTSNADMNYSYRAYCLYISNTSPFKVITFKEEYIGQSVRPVSE